MKCSQCGKKVPKNSKLCPFCQGTEFVEEENYLKIVFRKGKNRRIAIIVLSVLFVSLVGLLIAWNTYFKYTKIHLNKYVSIVEDSDSEYGSYDGCGEYCGELNVDKLVDDIYYSSGGEKGSKSDIKELIEDNIKIKKGTGNGSLRNGQLFSVKIKYDNSIFHKYGIHLLDKEKTQKVKGLIKTEELDPFENAELKTKGVSPNMLVAVANKKYPGLDTLYTINGENAYDTANEEDDEEDEDYDENDYSLGDLDSYYYTETNYKKGDDIKVSINQKIYYNEESEKVYLLVNRKHTYTIEQSPEYLKTDRDLSGDSMSTIIGRGKELIDNCIGIAGYITEYKTKYLGAYLAVSKKGEKSNTLIIIYKLKYDDYPPDNVGYVAVETFNAYKDKEVKEGLSGLEPVTLGTFPDNGDDFLYEFIKKDIDDFKIDIEASYDSNYKVYHVGSVPK